MMRVRHGDHTHEVTLLDDGTLDTVLDVDGHEVRHCEAERSDDGSVRMAWLRDAARSACDEGLIGDDD
jgi:hypothetical protein